MEYSCADFNANPVVFALLVPLTEEGLVAGSPPSASGNSIEGSKAIPTDPDTRSEASLEAGSTFWTATCAP